MAAELLPIRFQEQLQLQTLGINAASIGFNTLTLESDRWICVREKSGENGTQTVVVIDLQDPAGRVMRRPISADSAIMHPDANVIGLKAGRQIQVFDLDRKQKVRSYLMPEDVVYWRWLGPATLGLVTEKAVYHWQVHINPQKASDLPSTMSAEMSSMSLENISKSENSPSSQSSDEEDPKKVFDRHPSLNNSQIISYRTDATGRWLLLVGIVAQAGKVVGFMQLYNLDRGVSQALEGHAGAFIEVKLDDAPHPTRLFSFAVRPASGGPGKLHIVEIDKRDGNPAYPKRAVDIAFPPEAEADFPVAMQASSKWGVLYVITKFGFLQIFDVATGTCLFANRISSETVFVTTEWRRESGVIGVNRKGQVLAASLDERLLLSYVRDTLNLPDLALTLCLRHGGNIPGSDDLFAERFAFLMSNLQYDMAAKVAARSPGGCLRTPETIEALKSADNSCLLSYFMTILQQENGEKNTQLNAVESLELARPVLAQGKKPLLERWLSDNRLTCSRELGDEIYPTDPALSLTVYVRGDVTDRACETFVALGQFTKLVLYVRKTNYPVDWINLLETTISSDVPKAVEFGKILVCSSTDLGSFYSNNSSGTASPNIISRKNSDINFSSLVEPERLFDLFVRYELVQEAVSVVAEVLKSNRPEDADLQTKVLVLAAQRKPAVAETLFSTNVFKVYDHDQVAAACEASGMVQRSLELYINSPSDFVRVLRGASSDLNAEWVASLLVRSKVDAVAVATMLRTLLLTDEKDLQQAQRFMPLLAAATRRVPDKNTIALFLDIYQDINAQKELYQVTRELVNTSQNKAVHLKHIGAALEAGDLQEVERVCRTSNFIDPPAAWSLLKSYYESQYNLQTQPDSQKDPLPLVIIADRFGMVKDLIFFLQKHNLKSYVTVYSQKVNPSRLPDVVSALLEVSLDANDHSEFNNDPITDEELLNLISGTPPQKYSLTPLIETLGNYHRLHIMKPVLEERMRIEAAAAKDSSLHTALCKVYISLIAEESNNINSFDDSRLTTEVFLKENTLYDSLDVGKYCDQLGLHDLALLAYERGQHDREFISLSTSAGLFINQVIYLLKRRDAAVWKAVLDPSNVSRDRLIDALVDNGANNVVAEDVSCAVKSLIAADLSKVLVSFLERIIYSADENELGLANPEERLSTKYGQNKSLQNLLLLTAIKSAPEKVLSHLERLDKYDAADVAKACANQKLWEEAFLAWRSCTPPDNASAVKCLLELGDKDRAVAFCEEVNERAVWSVLGRALLRYDPSLVQQAVEVFARSEDVSAWIEVVRGVQKGESQLSSESVKNGRNFSSNDSLSSSHGNSPVISNSQITVQVAAREALLPYLLGVRKTVSREPTLDNEIIFTYAALGRTSDVEDFLAKPHSAQVPATADRCFRAGLFHAARALYETISNQGRLSVCLVKLGDLQGAVEAAKKSPINSESRTIWNEILNQCLERGDYPLGQICGLRILQLKGSATDIQSLQFAYESRGLGDELISLFDACLTGETVPNIHTELALIMARHSKEDSLIEFFKLHHERINVVRVASACSDEAYWAASANLYAYCSGSLSVTTDGGMSSGRGSGSAGSISLANNQSMNGVTSTGVSGTNYAEKAIRIILDHPGAAFDHSIVCKALGSRKPISSDLLMRLVQFYVEEGGPQHIEEVLSLIGGSRLDPTRLVEYLRDQELLPLAASWLANLQLQANSGSSSGAANTAAVNLALNEWLLAQEDVEGLRASLARSQKFDCLNLAKRLASHELPAFRLLAVSLYRNARMWSEATDLLLSLGYQQAAIALAASAGSTSNPPMAVGLLKKFAERGQIRLFLATCYSCLDNLSGSMIQDVAWERDWLPAVVPFVSVAKH